MKVYGYPRAGNHLLMAMLAQAFPLNTTTDYRDMFGGHFSSEPARRKAGEAPTPADAAAIAIRRHPRSIARSIWQMRAWFGLTTPLTYDNFLLQPYKRSFALGGDACFANIDLNPIEHIVSYYGVLRKRCRVVVCYEALITDPHTE